MTNTTVGVYNTHAEAEAAIRELTAFGVADSDISYIYADKEGEVKDGQTGEKVATGAVAGATTGAVVGGIAGLIVANGILPGLGSLFVAGPLAVALGFTGAAATTVAGAATGAAAGGFLGALTQFGVTDEDASLYEGMVRDGSVVVITRTDERSTKEVFQRTHAMEVREYIS